LILKKGQDGGRKRLYKDSNFPLETGDIQQGQHIALEDEPPEEGESLLSVSIHEVIRRDFSSPWVREGDPSITKG